MWFHLGNLAIQKEDYTLARRAFENGLLTQPSHWQTIDKLIDVKYCIT